MSEPSGLATILEPTFRFLGAVAAGVVSINWSLWLSRLASLLVLPWRLLRPPLSFILRSTMVILSPVLYPLSFLLSIALSVLGIFAGLEPLYTFFGVAAIVGGLAGLVMAVISGGISSQLGLTDGSQEDTASVSSKGQRLRSPHSMESPFPPPLSTTGDLDWTWFDSSSPVRRMPPSGLLSQTIHEEDDTTDPSS